MNRHVLANMVVIADSKHGGLACILPILWVSAHNATRMQLVSSAHVRATNDGDMFIEHTPSADLNVWADYAVGADKNIIGKFSRRVDDCSGVNLCHSAQAMLARSSSGCLVGVNHHKSNLCFSNLSSTNMGATLNRGRSRACPNGLGLKNQLIARRHRMS
jgi:hypothetical protein